MWSVRHSTCIDVLALGSINCWLTDAASEFAWKASMRWVKGPESRPFETGFLYGSMNHLQYHAGT